MLGPDWGALEDEQDNEPSLKRLGRRTPSHQNAPRDSGDRFKQAVHSVVAVTGNSIELAASAGVAVVQTLGKRTGLRRGNNSRTRNNAHDGSVPLLDPELGQFLKRDPFLQNRRRILENPDRARETLEPYAHLELEVIEAWNLAPKDSGILFSSSTDPYAEVWINDFKCGTTPWLLMRKHPKWRFSIDLEVYSPESIVHVRVLDHDTFTRNDLVGFVEFCVADLVPNKEINGWFELRNDLKLKKTAPVRLLKHMRHRDDDDSRKSTDSTEASMKSTMTHQSTESSVARHDQVTVPSVLPPKAVEHLGANRQTSDMREQVSSSTKRSEDHARRLQAILTDTQRKKWCMGCRGRPPRDEATEDAGRVSRNGVTASVERKNAGEVHLSMKLNSCAHDDASWKETVMPRSPTVANVEAERHAFAFPPIVFDHVMTKGDVAEHSFDMSEIFCDVFEIKNMLLNYIFLQAWTVVDFIITWKRIPLTATVLAWWWLFCVWPLQLLWTTPMWPAFFLCLLRDERWRLEIAAFPRTAPLNDAGFRLIASLNNSQKMVVWIQRVVLSSGGEIKNIQGLQQLAPLVFREGTPRMTFEQLSETLRQVPWIHTGSQQKTCEAGHFLKYLGHTKYDECHPPLKGEPKQSWSCQRSGGCFHHINKLNSSNVGRFHCARCDYDVCEFCVFSAVTSPYVLSIPREYIPMPGILIKLFESAELPVHDARILLTWLISRGTRPFEQSDGGRQSACKIYKCFACASLGVAVLTALFAKLYEERIFRMLCHILYRGLWISLGSMVFAVRLPFVERCWRWYKAGIRQVKYIHRRETGGPAQHWAFFTPTDIAENSGQTPTV